MLREGITGLRGPPARDGGGTEGGAGLCATGCGTSAGSMTGRDAKEDAESTAETAAGRAPWPFPLTLITEATGTGLLLSSSRIAPPMTRKLSLLEASGTEVGMTVGTSPT
jgi:hypothetical protein